jgi:hypothetical protein
MQMERKTIAGVRLGFCGGRTELVAGRVKIEILRENHASRMYAMTGFTGTVLNYNHGLRTLEARRPGARVFSSC